MINNPEQAFRRIRHQNPLQAAIANGPAAVDLRVSLPLTTTVQVTLPPLSPTVVTSELPLSEPVIRTSLDHGSSLTVSWSVALLLSPKVE